MLTRLVYWTIHGPVFWVKSDVGNCPTINFPDHLVSDCKSNLYFRSHFSVQNTNHWKSLDWALLIRNVQLQIQTQFHEKGERRLTTARLMMTVITSNVKRLFVCAKLRPGFCSKGSEHWSRAMELSRQNGSGGCKVGAPEAHLTWTLPGRPYTLPGLNLMVPCHLLALSSWTSWSPSSLSWTPLSIDLLSSQTQQISPHHFLPLIPCYLCSYPYMNPPTKKNKKERNFIIWLW